MIKKILENLIVKTINNNKKSLSYSKVIKEEKINVQKVKMKEPLSY